MECVSCGSAKEAASAMENLEPLDEAREYAPLSKVMVLINVYG